MRAQEKKRLLRRFLFINLVIAQLAIHNVCHCSQLSIHNVCHCSQLSIHNVCHCAPLAIRNARHREPSGVAISPTMPYPKLSF